MTVLRISKRKNNFLIIDKTCLKDATLSWGAKGLHAYLMGMQDDWRVHVADLKTHAKNGRDSVRALLKELEGAGYITREWVRDEISGKFSRLEYTVYELPQTQPDSSLEPTYALSPKKSEPEKPSAVYFSDEIPSPGNPFTVVESLNSPSPGNQSPVNPGPEKPTLISINNNKYQNKKEITAAAIEGVLDRADVQEEKPAAAFFDEKSPTPKTALFPLLASQSEQDAVIGKQLTTYQQEKLRDLVERLRNDGYTVLPEEIEYCLLSPEHFKRSGQDFGRKLNAIRTVILRGEWQIPAGMVLFAQKKSDNQKHVLQTQYREARAEVHHFQSLLQSVNESTRATIETILSAARQKLTALECQLKET